jgi:hypothetical protein
MSRLEGRVKPLIGPTIRLPTAPLVLSVDEQQVLAKWAVKTALVVHAVDVTDPEIDVIEQHRKWFKGHRDEREDSYGPPPGSSVSIFLRRPVDESGRRSMAYFSYFHGTMRSQHSTAPASGEGLSGPNHYVSTFAVGYLGFQVVGVDRGVGGVTRLDIQGDARADTGVLIPIWPAVAPRNRWPPTLVVGTDLLEWIAHWGVLPTGETP